MSQPATQSGSYLDPKALAPANDLGQSASTASTSQDAVCIPIDASIADVLATDQDAAHLQEMLTEDRSPSGASADTKFTASGRDFHRPQIETAALSVLLNRPSSVQKACR